MVMGQTDGRQLSTRRRAVPMRTPVTTMRMSLQSFLPVTGYASLIVACRSKHDAERRQRVQCIDSSQIDTNRKERPAVDQRLTGDGEGNNGTSSGLIDRIFGAGKV